MQSLKTKPTPPKQHNNLQTTNRNGSEGRWGSLTLICSPQSLRVSYIHNAFRFTHFSLQTLPRVKGIRVHLPFLLVSFFRTYDFIVIDQYLQEQQQRTKMPVWECDWSWVIRKIWGAIILHNYAISHFRLVPVLRLGCRSCDCALLPVAKMLGPRGVRVQPFVRDAPVLPREGQTCSSWEEKQPSASPHSLGTFPPSLCDWRCGHLAVFGKDKTAISVLICITWKSNQGL